ncbi:ATP-binding cassette domain-containing protein [Microbacterium kribbense]
MPEGQVLEFSGLSKRFGSILAVDSLTARVEPGAVTGFLGPNGAGKTTTLRMLLGLVRPSAGQVTIGGMPYAKLAQPLQTVGAVLESSSFHPGRTAANHLKVYAQAAGLPAARVDEALGVVGLADVAGRKCGGFSLGMHQRLGLAGALLADPGVLVLDEPTNGLDPEGITWMRGLLREMAKQGRTVLVSSHLLAEVQQTVDRLMIISAGRLVFQGEIGDLTDPSEFATVVDAPDRAALVAALEQAGISYEPLRAGLTVRGVDAVGIGRIAADAGVALSVLQRRGPALEEVFFGLVNGLRMHPSGQGAAGAPGASAPAAALAAVATTGTASESAEAAGDAGTGPGAADDAAPEAGTPDDAAPDATMGDAAGDDPGGPDGEASDETGTGAEPAEHSEPEPTAAPDTAGADDDATPDAGEPAGAAFAVASTGVIDIVTADAEAEPETEAAGAESEPAEPESTRAEEEVVAGEPEQLPEDDGRHEQQTESDVAADEFFHSFDEDGTQQQPSGEEAEDAASDTDSDAPDGGDRR